MSRSGRLLELTHLLAGRRRLSIDEIARRFEISQRTAYRDLAELSRRKIPVVRDEGGYHLLETATLRPLNLTAEEHAVLKVALENPALRRHAPLRRTLDALGAKLDAVTAHVEESPEALRLATVDRSGPAAGEALEPLRRAIEERLETEILYSSLSGGTRRWRGVHPYRLFHRGGAWYLVGHCLTNGEPRLFRLDRIGGVRTLGVAFEPPAGFDLDAFLADAWKVFRGRESREVVLRFEKSLAPLIMNARHHPGEEKRQLEDGSVDYRVELSSLEEVARWVAGFGGGASVLAPPELQDRVRSLARGTLGALDGGAAGGPGGGAGPGPVRSLDDSESDH